MTVRLLPTFLACPQAPWAYENDALNPDRESMVDKLADLLKKGRIRHVVRARYFFETEKVLHSNNFDCYDVVVAGL